MSQSKKANVLTITARVRLANGLTGPWLRAYFKRSVRRGCERSQSPARVAHVECCLGGDIRKRLAPVDGNKCCSIGNTLGVGDDRRKGAYLITAPCLTLERPLRYESRNGIRVTTGVGATISE